MTNPSVELDLNTIRTISLADPRPAFPNPLGFSQAINNLQSTFSGFGFVNRDNVFKVCDQPHPLLVKNVVASCLTGDIDQAYDGV